MSLEYDQQLLESVAVRRRRMVAALMFGADRMRRGYIDGVRRTLVGVVVAALMAAGCVGYSFGLRAFTTARQQEQQREAQRTGFATPAPSPSGYLVRITPGVGLAGSTPHHATTTRDDA